MEITLISRISLLIFYLYFLHFSFQTTWYQQECIPVGCVPPAAVAMCWCGGGSASVHAGIPPGCGPGDPPGCEPGDPLGCGLGDPPRPDPSISPLGVGLETPQGQTPQHPPWVWAWRPPPPWERQTCVKHNLRGR